MVNQLNQSSYKSRGTNTTPAQPHCKLVPCKIIMRQINWSWSHRCVETPWESFYEPIIVNFYPIKFFNGHLKHVVDVGSCYYADYILRPIMCSLTEHNVHNYINHSTNQINYTLDLSTHSLKPQTSSIMFNEAFWDRLNSSS